MADDKASAKAPSPSPTRAEDKPADKAPTGAAADVAARGAASGGVTEAMAAEFEEHGIIPALDNRTGRERPSRREFRAKPQQFPGPEVGHFAEHAEKAGGAFDEEFGAPADGGPMPGMHSGGPHGRADRSGASNAAPDGYPDARANA